jgi:hypothetical protein
MLVTSLARVRVRLRQVLLFCFAIVVFPGMPAVAAAQTTPGNGSHLGAKVSVVKAWTMSDQVKDLLSDENEQVSIDGSEFEIGFVRGSTYGGDWGVSFVRKPFKDGSGVKSTGQDCFNQAETICRPNTEVARTQNVLLTGVEVHWFIRVVNIAHRVQIGANVGGGIAQTSGQVVKTTDRFEPTAFNQQGPTAFNPIHEEETLEAKDELFPYFPLFKLEVVGSVILAPPLKVQFAYGMNFPANSARVMGVYLFGAR